MTALDVQLQADSDISLTAGIVGVQIFVFESVHAQGWQKSVMDMCIPGGRGEWSRFMYAGGVETGFGEPKSAFKQKLFQARFCVLVSD